MSIDNGTLGSGRLDWKHGFTGIVTILVFVVAAWILGMWPSVESMATIWLRSDTFAHGMVVLPISAYLVWRLRVPLSRVPVRFSIVGALFSMMAALIWALGVTMSVASLEHLSAVGVLVFGLWAAIGIQAFRIIAFPAFFLLFMAPVGEFLVPTLIHHTAEFTVGALRATGIPVYQEGNQFIVPNGRWSVVDACSGIRYLIASAMVGTLYGYLNYKSSKKRVVFGLLSLIVPILANWLRAYLIVMIGYLSNNKLAAGVDHLIYGWVFFGLVILAMFWIGSFWSDPPETASNEIALPPSIARPLSGVLTGIILMLLPVGLLAIVSPKSSVTTAILQRPMAASGWELAGNAPAFFSQTLNGARSILEATYVLAENKVHLQIALFESQVPGYEMVNWENRLNPNKDVWSESRISNVELAGQAFRHLRLSSSSQTLHVWTSFLVSRRWIDSDFNALLALAWNRISTGSDRSARVLVWVNSEDPGHAAQLAAKFMADHRTAIEHVVVDAVVK